MAPWTMAAFCLRYRSAHTRRAYLGDWQRFCEQCQQLFGVALHDLSIEGLSLWSEDVVLAWLRWHERADTTCDARTRAGRLASRRRVLASLSAYSRYLIRRRFLQNNPMTELLALHSGFAQHERSEALNETEMQTLLKFVSSAPHPKAARSKARRDLTEVVIWTLLTIGMRVSELTGLRIQDVLETPEGMRLVLTLKGGHAHDPLVHPHTAEKIRNYLRSYRSGAAATEPLFVRAQQVKGSPRRMSQYGIYRMVTESVQQAGIAKRISPHGLRATLATTLVRQGIPLAHIRDLLGHSSIQTTSIYVKRATALTESATLQMDTNQLFGYDPKDP
jgi:site-specific recombinase XerD